MFGVLPMLVDFRFGNILTNMSEAKKGFLGLSTSDWGRVLSSGGYSLLERGDTEEEQDTLSAELSPEETVAKAKNLGRAMLAAKNELDILPRDALIEAAWHSIAHYHREATIWGPDAEGVQAFEEEKELRFSLLTDEERERAIFLANDWLDGNFDK